MEKSLLLELNRQHQIMGIKPKFIISEGPGWGWLDDLIRKSPKVFEQFEHIFKTIRAGGKLTDKQIDDVVDAIKNIGKLTEDEAVKLKNVLKNDSKIRSLLNTTDDFLTDLKKLYPDGNAPEALFAITKTASLTTKQIDNIINSVVSSAVKNVGSNANKLLNSFESTYGDYLDKVYNNGEYLNNVDEIYDIMDGKLNEILKKNIQTGPISKEVAEKLYDELTIAFRNSEKIKSKISKLESEGRILGNPKTTIPTKFNEAGELSSFDDIIVRNADGTKKVKSINQDSKVTRKKTSSLTDEQGRPIENVESLSDEISNKYNNLKNKTELTDSEKLFIEEVEKWKNFENNLNKVEDLSKKIDDELIQKLEQNIDDSSTWGPLVDEVGELSPAWSDIFFKKMFQGPWGETLVNLFRGMFRKPEQFVLDGKKTLTSIQKKFEELSKLNPGDAAYKKVKSELDELAARLKSDTMLSQTKDKMFVTQWEIIKDSIRANLNYAEAEKLISILGKSGNPKNSIDSFVEWSIKDSNKPTFIDVLKQYNTFSDFWSSSKLSQWTKEYKEIWKKEAQFISGFYATGKQILSDFLKFTFVRLPNLLIFGVFSLRKELLEILKGTGRLSGLGGIKNIMLLYIRVTIISNLIHPFINLFTNFFKETIEDNIPGLELFELEEKTVWLQFVKDLQERVPLLGNDFEWNPFYNPIPKNAAKNQILKFAALPYIEAEDIGFKPAPLPNMVWDFVVRTLNADTTVDQVEELKKDMQEELNKSVNEFYKNLTPEAKEKLKNESTYYILKDNNFDTSEKIKFFGLTQDEIKTLTEHMYFKIQGIHIPTEGEEKNKLEQEKNIAAEIETPSINNVLGQTWACSVKPTVKDGVDVCEGDSWRVIIYNDMFLKKDPDFDKFINDPNNNMSRKYVYVVNKSVENDRKIPVGSNNKNLKPIKDLLPKLK